MIRALCVGLRLSFAVLAANSMSAAGARAETQCRIDDGCFAGMSEELRKRRPNCAIHPGDDQGCVRFFPAAFAFSPDSRDLYFSFHYRWVADQISRDSIARYDLHSDTLALHRWSCAHDYSGFVISPTGRYEIVYKFKKFQEPGPSLHVYDRHRDVQWSDSPPFEPFRSTYI
ncbi:MAG: hypothetical protein ACREIP_19860, partial [Alphaproteobacteria bacterium]